RLHVQIQLGAREFGGRAVGFDARWDEVQPCGVQEIACRASDVQKLALGNEAMNRVQAKEGVDASAGIFADEFAVLLALVLPEDLAAAQTRVGVHQSAPTA